VCQRPRPVTERRAQPIELRCRETRALFGEHWIAGPQGKFHLGTDSGLNDDGRIAGNVGGEGEGDALPAGRSLYVGWDALSEPKKEDSLRFVGRAMRRTM
jgi:hypothetical protein